MENEHNLLESDVVTLTLDDDEELECAIITTFNIGFKQIMFIFHCSVLLSI